MLSTCIPSSISPPHVAPAARVAPVGLRVEPAPIAAAAPGSPVASDVPAATAAGAPGAPVALPVEPATTPALAAVPMASVARLRPSGAPSPVGDSLVTSPPRTTARPLAAADRNAPAEGSRARFRRLVVFTGKLS